MTVRRGLRTLALVIVGLVAVAAVGVAAIAVLAVRVDGTSMAPTLADGQRILVAPGTRGEAARFDIVVLTQPGTGIGIVKRVIAVAGDGLSVHGDPAVVEVRPGNVGPWRRVENGAWSDRWRLVTPCCDDGGREDPVGGAVVVPPEKLFVLGDNPDASEDSRDFGWVELASVQGRVRWSAWPPEQIRTSVHLR